MVVIIKLANGNWQIAYEIGYKRASNEFKTFEELSRYIEAEQLDQVYA